MSEPKEQETYFKHNKSLDKESSLHTAPVGWLAGLAKQQFVLHSEFPECLCWQ